MIRVREFDMARDAGAVEEMERRCEAGPNMKTNKKNHSKEKRKGNAMSLYVDMLGDPMSRVRHALDHVMMVAEYGDEREMAGVVRACIKTVSRGMKTTNDDDSTSTFAKVAYILGLRVSPTHRRRGIGTKLVERVEEWCAQRGADYAYMATDRSNTVSINLFTHRLSYVLHCSPVILVQPVHAHHHPLRCRTSILRLSPSLAELIYRRLFTPTSVEFFPSDIGAVLHHRLTLGTFLATEEDDRGRFPPKGSFAVMSLWNCSEIFRLRIAGASAVARVALRLARAIDKWAPWMRIPSVRDVFRPFGIWLMYGLHMAGERGGDLMSELCRAAHNMAMVDKSCAAVVAEVGAGDPVRAAVPRWRRVSCEDVWCMKRLAGESLGNCATMPPTATEVIFVDPREF